MVFYDECFESAFKNMTNTKIRTIMAIVSEIFSQHDSLETTINFPADFPIVQKLESNWCDNDWSDLAKNEGELGLIASGSTFPAHAYIFLTHLPYRKPSGIANLGSVCDPRKSNRIGIIQYGDTPYRHDGDNRTAEVF